MVNDLIKILQKELETTSQVELAERLGIGRQTLIRILRGSHVPKLDIFESVLRKLGYNTKIVKKRRSAVSA